MNNRMTTKVSSHTVSIGLVAVLSLIVVAASWLVSCTSTLDGEQTANQQPTVFFVNIPPEGQQFSRNPVVYWFGSDPDGLIDYYRYHVGLRSDVDNNFGGDPMAYINSIPDAEWNVNDVDPSVSDPQTEQSVALQADPTSPVLNYVDQYVFIQAFDEEGLGSVIQYRLFSRNNNPPQTLINGFSPFLPFVNAVSKDQAGPISGIRLSWQATDEIDWPSDAPPFQFEWRLYGPYTNAEYTNLTSRFFTQILQTSDGRLFRLGDSIEVCDTNLVNDTLAVSCTTYVVNSGVIANLPTGFASFQPWFRVEEPDWDTSTYNRLVTSSAEEANTVDGSWVYATADTIYDAFRFDPNDTTVQKRFIFWIRGRDDALTPDLVPAFTRQTILEVIDAKQERDVLFVNYTGQGPSAIPTDTMFNVWRTWIQHWQMNRTDNPIPAGSPLLWNQTQDYYLQAGKQSEIPLRNLLSHRIMILHNDVSIQKSGIQDFTANLFKAIDGGVNAWMAMRCIFAGNTFSEPFTVTPIVTVKGGVDFQNYFGINQVTFSGWGCSSFAPYYPGPDLLAICPGGRIEDFVGTYSLNETEYPSLDIDTTRLRTRYDWGFSSLPQLDSAWAYYPDLDTAGGAIGALPEVGWSARVTPGTEIIYLYKSLYGDNHPFGFNYSFEGSPVAWRYNRGIFRTAYFNFTPVVFPENEAQQIVSSTLDFLFQQQISLSSRDGNATNRATADELAENYMRRVMENSSPEDFAPME